MASVPTAFTTGSGSGIIGPWNLITSTTVSGTPSSVSFTTASIVNYNSLWITFNALNVTAAACNLYIGFSTNGGSSYVVSCYGNVFNSSLAGPTDPVELLGGPTGAGGPWFYNGYIYLSNPNLTNFKPFSFWCVGTGPVSGNTGNGGGGVSASAIVQINALQLSCSGNGGTFTSGTVNLYGQ